MAKEQAAGLKKSVETSAAMIARYITLLFYFCRFFMVLFITFFFVN